MDGIYDPTVDWSRDETWNGYKAGDEKFTRYSVGQRLDGDKGSKKVESISYYDINGEVHKNVPVKTTHLGTLNWGYDKMAPLIITKSSSDITVKDFNCINSVPIMVTQGQIDGHLTPEGDRVWGVATSYELPTRDGLSICSEDTVPVKPTANIFTSSGAVDKNKLKKYIDGGGTFNSAESAWLVRSSAYNERGHALATLGDRVIFENVRAIGNQDSVWASDGRVYFKNCTLIGGTDYIYGSASAVFDSCNLGFIGFTDQKYGNPLGTPNTDKSRNYGYLFWNCKIYSEGANGGDCNFGGSWGGDGQSTFYNCIIDDNNSLTDANGNKLGKANASIIPAGWGRFDAEKGLSRLYEYGTTNASGKKIDFSKRIKNKPVAEGGPGMGTVLNDWQALEFNPRNYFSKVYNDASWSSDWDPMGFGSTYLQKVDAAMNNATVNIPSNDDTTVALPQAPNGISFKWESVSTNAVVSEDGTKITVIRPAVGEANIESSVILYAMDNENHYGNKKEIPVIITPTTNTTDVFNIPINITSAAEMDTDSDFVVTISKNGAIIKKQTITMQKGQKTVSATIANVPSSAEGIEYDVRIVPSNDLVSLKTPVDGETKVTGITGSDVTINVEAQVLVDDTVDLAINYSSADKNKTYDLIALAKEKGASSDIDTSDIITITYTLDVTPTTSGNSFIDIVSGTPSSSVKASALDNRFALAKLGHWNQLDIVDCSQGYGGASNTDGQWLNACGKFEAGKPSTASITIDYKTKTVSATGAGSSNKATYQFTHFPKTYTKGSVNMAVYAGGETFSMHDVKVTYKKIAGK